MLLSPLPHFQLNSNLCITISACVSALLSEHLPSVSFVGFQLPLSRASLALHLLWINGAGSLISDSHMTRSYDITKIEDIHRPQRVGSARIRSALLHHAAPFLVVYQTGAVRRPSVATRSKRTRLWRSGSRTGLRLRTGFNSTALEL